MDRPVWPAGSAGLGRTNLFGPCEKRGGLARPLPLRAYASGPYVGRAGPLTHPYWDPFTHPLPPLNSKKGGGGCRLACPGKPRLPQEVSWCTPQIVKFIPPFRILWKSYRSIAKAYRTWFSSFSSALSPILSEICLLRVSEMLRKPRMPFFNKMDEVVAAQLAQAS